VINFKNHALECQCGTYPTGHAALPRNKNTYMNIIIIKITAQNIQSLQWWAIIMITNLLAKFDCPLYFATSWFWWFGIWGSIVA